jgi:hypothetical protein
MARILSLADGTEINDLASCIAAPYDNGDVSLAAKKDP